jgi:hypothetical protein
VSPAGKAVVAAGILLAATGEAVAAEGAGAMTIQGTVRLAPGAESALAPGDRLVLKIFHPGDGVEMDPKYQIQTDFALPTAFRITPPIDMNANARWPTYVVEAFTDRDGDVLSQVAGELYARTPEALSLGTGGVVLELAPRTP